MECDEIRIKRELLLRLKDAECSLVYSDLLERQIGLASQGSTVGNDYSTYTIKEMESRLGLSEAKQRKSLRKLQMLGYVSVQVKGQPPKRMIRIISQKNYLGGQSGLFM
jgi:Fic family protein